MGALAQRRGPLHGRAGRANHLAALRLGGLHRPGPLGENRGAGEKSHRPHDPGQSALGPPGPYVRRLGARMVGGGAGQAAAQLARAGGSQGQGQGRRQPAGQAVHWRRPPDGRLSGGAPALGAVHPAGADYRRRPYAPGYRGRGFGVRARAQAHPVRRIARHDGDRGEPRISDPGRVVDAGDAPPGPALRGHRGHLQPGHARPLVFALPGLSPGIRAQPGAAALAQPRDAGRARPGGRHGLPALRLGDRGAAQGRAEPCRPVAA